MTQTIGILGSGLAGKAIAHLATAAGYKVVIANSRGPETLASLVEDLGPLARAGTIREAIDAADIVNISIPLASFEKLPADDFAGKITIDQTNYYPGMGDFHRVDLDNAELTSSELLQRHLPEARLVKGLHNLSWIHMEADAQPEGRATRTTLPVAGDDAEAKAEVTKFIEKIGFDVIDAGSLAESWRIEPETGIYFWRYAPDVPDGLSHDEAKRAYQQPGKPLSREEARRLIQTAKRPSPIGGNLAAMPQIHVDLFMEQASAGTV